MRGRRRLSPSYARAGYRRVLPALIQPAEPFLDLSGEDIRQRMFLTTDRRGKELCLRPDFTIAVSRDYLGFGGSRPSGRLLLSGPGVPPGRRRPQRIPAGRRGIRSAAPTPPPPMPRCSRSGLKRSPSSASTAPEIRMGDVGLFTALIEGLDLAPAWKRRLVKDFNRAGRLERDLDVLAVKPAGTRSEYEGVLAAMARSEPKAAHALVIDLLSIAGINAVGGRSVEEIADRFLEQAALGSQTSLPHEMAQLIERFLWITGDPDKVAAESAHARERRQRQHRMPRSTCSRAAPASSPRAASTSRASASRPGSSSGSTTTPASSSACTIRPAASRRRWSPAAATTSCSAGSARTTPIPAVGLGVWIERLDRLREGVMSGAFVIAVPAKGRLQEHTDAFFARAGPRARQAARRARLSRRHQGPARRRGRLSLGLRDHAAAGAGRRAFRRHRRRPGARGDARSRRQGGAARSARLRRRQCDRRGAAGLDRRQQHGRSRRRRDRVPHQARPQDAGRDQISQSHARLLLASTASPTIASSRARARPKRRRRPAPPS